MRRSILVVVFIGTITLSACTSPRSTRLTAVTVTPHPLLTSTPACAFYNKTETPSNGLPKARNTLLEFFELLNQQEYEKAAALFGGDYQGLHENNPLIDLQDHVDLLKSGCEINGLQCLRVNHIVDEKTVSFSEYQFIVEFTNADGSLFVRGPCCGASETEMSSESQFRYTVRRDCSGQFFVLELPIGVP